MTDSVEQNAAMVDKLLLPFPILSDTEAVVIKKFGVYVEGHDPTLTDTIPEPGIAKPATFVIRPDLSIAFEHIARDRIIWIDRPLDREILAAIGMESERGQG